MSHGQSTPADRREADPAPVDRAEVAARWRSLGYGCDLWVDPPGQVWADFIHETDEWVCVMDGILEMEYDGRCLRMQAGDECHIPAGSMHTVRNVGGTTARWLYGYRGAAC